MAGQQAVDIAFDIITGNDQLELAMDRFRGAAYVTVDTEFVRDNTYWPRLCLVQIASDDHACIIDPLEGDLDLTPFHDLMADRSVLKVFHAARQDIEIFFHDTGSIPHPVFDTQIAAMVCGYGDAAAYETLVRQLANRQLDKSQRFTDWARRPLSTKQLGYAIGDVTYLRDVYKALYAQVLEQNREAWMAEEIEVLLSPDTYRLDPEEGWRRIKTRSGDRRMLGVLREVTAWRDRRAQSRDVPRNRVLRDEALLEIAATRPRSRDELARLRNVGKGISGGNAAPEIIEAVGAALALQESELPRVHRRKQVPNGARPTIELLKVLLKQKCERHGVAQKLVASAEDLERIATGDLEGIPALHGWRMEIFGSDALALKNGEIAITVRNGATSVIRTPG